MGTYDIFMLVVLAAAVAFGAWKGLAWQIASLASLVASYLVALTFSGPLAPFFGDSAPWNRFLAMLVLYVATSAVIWLAFGVLRKGIDRVKLQEFDRQMGALVGGVKGVLICVAITFFAVTLLEDPTRGEILDSRSGRTIAKLIDKADAVAPPEIHDVLGPYLHKVNETLGNDPHVMLPENEGGFTHGLHPGSTHNAPMPPNATGGFNPGFNGGFQPTPAPTGPPTYDPNYQPNYPPVSQPAVPPPNWGP